MPNTKTPPNAVRTASRSYTYFLDKLIFRGQNVDYYMTKAEMSHAINHAFNLKDTGLKARVYSTHDLRLDYLVETNGDTRNDFFAIGCMKFSRNTTVKIAKWAGFSKNWIAAYIQ